MKSQQRSSSPNGWFWSSRSANHPLAYADGHALNLRFAFLFTFSYNLGFAGFMWIRNIIQIKCPVTRLIVPGEVPRHYLLIRKPRCSERSPRQPMPMAHPLPPTTHHPLPSTCYRSATAFYYLLLPSTTFYYLLLATGQLQPDSADPRLDGTHGPRVRSQESVVRSQ